MALTLTSTAYSKQPKALHAGVFSVNFDYTSAAAVTFCASANATVILGPKVEQGTTINDIFVYCSSGAGTTPVDVGIDASISKFASAITAGSRAMCVKGNLPYLVSVSDDAANLFKTVVYGVTPGTNTAVVQLKSTIYCTRDPN